MPRATVHSSRPVALVVWARRERERLNAWLLQYAGLSGIPEVDYQEFLDAGRPLFFFMYEQLSPAEREAETRRLAAASAFDPRDEAFHSDAFVWQYHAGAWILERRRARREAEVQAAHAAREALGRCAYLGGYRDFPARRALCAVFVDIGRRGSLSFRTRGDREICSIPWPEVRELRVLSVEEAPARPGGLRWRSVSLIAKPREAALGIVTVDGEALVVVRGREIGELRGALTKLIDCIGQPTADSYEMPRVAFRPPDASTRRQSVL